MIIHQDNAGHMTQMAAMSIYGKKLYKSSFQEHCMKHQRPQPFIFCSNNDHWLTLTYFMTMSNFAT